MKDSPLKTYILDIDGTLVRTHTVDNQCYWQAVHEVFGREDETQDLNHFEHVTDNGILQQWAAEELGRSLTSDETRLVKTRFLALLKLAQKEQPLNFNGFEGASEFLASISGSNDAVAAIATGGWLHSARYKLSVSGLDRFQLPLATAESALSRTGIMQAALNLLHPGNKPSPSSITYIGDGPWDFRASQELGWNFIGIASGKRSDQLKKLGAQTVHEDFQPLLRKQQRP